LNEKYDVNTIYLSKQKRYSARPEGTLEGIFYDNKIITKKEFLPVYSKLDAAPLPSSPAPSNFEREQKNEKFDLLKKIFMKNIQTPSNSISFKS